MITKIIYHLRVFHGDELPKVLEESVSLIIGPPGLVTVELIIGPPGLVVVELMIGPPGFVTVELIIGPPGFTIVPLIVVMWSPEELVVLAFTVLAGELVELVELAVLVVFEVTDDPPTKLPN